MSDEQNVVMRENKKNNIPDEALAEVRNLFSFCSKFFWIPAFVRMIFKFVSST